MKTTNQVGSLFDDALVASSWFGVDAEGASRILYIIADGKDVSI
jgi:hypothetical protein